MRFFRFIEIALGCLAVIWGIWLLGFHTYPTLASLESFRVWLVPEWFLISVPGLLGLGLFVLRTNAKRTVHLLLCLFWAFITFGIAETNITLTAIPLYATVSFLHAGIYLIAKE